jgi:hypothetical protein
MKFYLLKETKSNLLEDMKSNPCEKLNITYDSYSYSSSVS